jgi:CheY-like chemotaxis protein/two-component sensor histidine kinase
VLTDIDQRKREEEALREAARRKDEFLATLAHELRNPLAPLRNGLEILRLTQDAQSAAQVRAMMERQLNQMVRLVDDLLDLSRITRGTVELRLAPCDLAAIVHSAVETSRPVIEARGHSLRVALPEASVELTADAARLSQVLANLLNNSAKYTEPGGEIELSGTCSAGRLTLRVRDPGMGIAPSLIAHVFDPFVQGESPVHRTQGGLGIGLTLVKRLVEMHHGTVEVRSEGPGCGSEFAVHLPLTGHQDRAAQAESPAESADPQSVRVLVADDNVDGAESLARLLDLSGHRVHTVHDGHAAVRVARQLQPEVALLDIGMPGLDGWEVARRIRALPGCEQTLLIALTGWGQAADRSRSREAGFDHHLVKPVDLATLRGLLRAHAANDAIEGGETPIAVGRGLDA